MSGASKMYRKRATSFLSKGERHSLTKIVRRFRWRCKTVSETAWSNGNLLQIYKCPKGWSSSLLLTNNANVWFSASPHLASKTYDQLCEALIKQFLSESDIWLLRQQLLNKQQTENERVAQFASEIRKLCLRLDLPVEGSVHFFINGLKPELKNYVLLQRPKTFFEAETCAKLKEALLLDEKPLDRTEEILIALSKSRSLVNLKQLHIMSSLRSTTQKTVQRRF